MKDHVSKTEVALSPHIFIEYIIYKYFKELVFWLTLECEKVWDSNVENADSYHRPFSSFQLIVLSWAQGLVIHAPRDPDAGCSRGAH